MAKRYEITYRNLFWFCIIGSLVGVVLEGVFTLIHSGHWETHTVTVWGPFCGIYGIGLDLFYVIGAKLHDKSKILQFIVCAVSADAIELACGLLLKYGLGMRAWDYSNSFMNYQGIICLPATLAWGFLGVLFIRYLLPWSYGHLENWNKTSVNRLCFAMSLFMAVNILVSAYAINRWSCRHYYSITASTQIQMLVDEYFDDSTMQSRFVEWHFLQ